MAFIELIPGHWVDAEELSAYCRPLMAGFKIPRSFFFVTEWPMSSTKIQKYELRKRLLDI